MLTEEQIQIMEKELNIKRDTRPDGKCVLGIYEEGSGCGRPAVNWLLNTASGPDGGIPQILNICKYHADAFGLK